jgi:flavodoxin
MMVYLIDDKKSRQETDYLWSTERFGQFKNIIKCIYTLQELEKESKEVFSNDNIILYHESFIDQTNKSEKAIDKRNKLYSWSENKGNIIVYFSGSKNTREVNDNIAHIPVSSLYANLEIFLKKIIINDINLEYLVFGENINIEKDLKFKQVVSLKETFKEEPAILKGKNLFICPSRDYISNPISQFDKKELFADVSDDKFNEKIYEWLNDTKYDNIFLPLCIGNILSDYSGLRLATHIRCTLSLNQLSRIYIYGFVGIEYLVQNEYFNILKTRNIHLLPFSKKAFFDAVNIQEESITIDQLPNEMKKLKLDVPSNYFDSHSIGNIWGMYRLLELEDIDFKSIISLNNERNNLNNLYFKYLQTINKTRNLVDETVKSSRSDYLVTLQRPKIIGKINLPEQKKSK